MPKKPKNNSHESTLGPFAKAVSEIADDKTTEDKPEAEPEEPGSGGDGDSRHGGRGREGRGTPGGWAPEEVRASSRQKPNSQRERPQSLENPGKAGFVHGAGGHRSERLNISAQPPENFAAIELDILKPSAVFRRAFEKGMSLGFRRSNGCGP